MDSTSEPSVRSKAAKDSPEQAVNLAELTGQLAKGDENAYRKFYDLYFERIGRYLLVVAAGNEESAREALQATLIRVVRHVRVFQDEKVFWHWLTVLARTAFWDQGKKRRRYLAFLDRFRSHAAVQQDMAAPVEADERLIAVLETALATLDSEERRILEWKYYEGRSVRDIAGQSGLSEKTVESRLVRVRVKLRKHLLTKLHNERA